MKTLREDAGIPLQYLQIDDGYQQVLLWLVVVKCGKRWLQVAASPVTFRY